MKSEGGGGRELGEEMEKNTTLSCEVKTNTKLIESEIHQFNFGAQVENDDENTNSL